MHHGVMSSSMYGLNFRAVVEQMMKARKILWLRTLITHCTLKVMLKSIIKFNHMDVIGLSIMLVLNIIILRICFDKFRADVVLCWVEPHLVSLCSNLEGCGCSYQCWTLHQWLAHARLFQGFTFVWWVQYKSYLNCVQNWFYSCPK